MNTHNPHPNTGAQLEAARLLRMHEIERLVGLKRSAIYGRIRAGDFPGPIALSGRCSRWRADAIAGWLEEHGGVQ